ncbi:uncharacterized protein PAC_19850 [Phialocephala subalpina]|uniref:Pentatricopeptide repeat domain-containing protein n=1 Tax=Phialocephala subalpina TaxID=576137 RepID=A0A1L7XY64_9HELO|nr:uncharacterized protein PAC_19850 [Phialocephala subalpina]
MRPKLQRLLSRPSSLDLLRYLVGIPVSKGCSATARRHRGAAGRVRITCRGYASAATAAREVVDDQHNESFELRDLTKAWGGFPHESIQPSPQPSRLPATQSHSIALAPATKVKRVYGAWDESLWTHDELDYQSSLDKPPLPGKGRLLDLDTYKQDMRLWGVMLEYRKRVYGDHGVLTFLNALTQRGVLIPTNGALADRFWVTFLDLGFRNHGVLRRVCQYANHILVTQKRRWSKLYAYVVRFFLANGDPTAASTWHMRLFKDHPPNSLTFAEMCRHVIIYHGDSKVLKTIYRKNTHRNVYAKVIPLLCQRENFKAALDWHYFLLRNGDVPKSSKVVEPLIHFLAVYKPNAAVEVTQSLVAAGVSFAPNLSKELNDNTKISREIMNVMHGETLNITAKQYNDGLGARWFATRWVSLDIAINAIHALGVQEIGPLSLQAIALRDPDPKSVTARINQLKTLGISISPLIYSRAIEHFASKGLSRYLEGLLHCDQHPDAYQDARLQEELLASFARNGDWDQYHRTLQIRSLAAWSPSSERWNLRLRAEMTLGHQKEVERILEHMRDEQIFVKSKSIAHLLATRLRRRRHGRGPMNVPGETNRGRQNDLNTVIRMLIGIMESGNYVPVIYWREIIRRLGMLGRVDDVRSVSLFLTTWYAPQQKFPLSRPSPYHIPSQVPTSHPLHPLRIIFGIPFQRAVVEWGFISSLRPKPNHSLDPRREVIPVFDPFLPKVTAGITLLKLLSQRGVHIDGPTVRKALFNRLITYYGPGRSDRKYNRWGKIAMQGKLSMAARQIDDALEGAYFSSTDLPRLVDAISRRRWVRVEKKKQRRLAKPHVQRKVFEGKLPFDGRLLPGSDQVMYSQVW